MRINGVKSILLLSILLVVNNMFVVHAQSIEKNTEFLTYEVTLEKQDLKLYWKDEKDKPLKSILNLKEYLKKRNKKLIFAMNAGMYKSDNSPQGLFIQNQKNITPLDTMKGNGNFYLKPNGVFYITTDNHAFICRTEDYIANHKVTYATQSGPMLVINGEIHPSFKKGSLNLNIRNGVGILPNNKIVFVMSKNEINFYDFANYFKSLGCKNALYLDGFVSRAYLPEKKWIQTDGNFGVMIGVTCK